MVNVAGCAEGAAVGAAAGSVNSAGPSNPRMFCGTAAARWPTGRSGAFSSSEPAGEDPLAISGTSNAASRNKAGRATHLRTRVRRVSSSGAARIRIG